MIELLFILLPIAAASGWYVAVKQFKSKQLSGSTNNTEYFQGLNYLLNEQTDKAIGVFVDLLDVDDETVEIHLALGTLFRQRGEVEKSIRLHQNLIARPELKQTVRMDVLNELGLDYMRAGLLDRAENIFLELEKDRRHTQVATKQLLSIYQQEKEWPKAIEYASKLEAVTGVKQPIILCHLNCEVAQQQLLKYDLSSARSQIKKAIKIDPLSIRASVMLAQLLMKDLDFKSALKILEGMIDKDERFVPVYLHLALTCLDKLNKPKQKLNFLRNLYERVGGRLVSNAFIDALIQYEEPENVTDFLTQQLHASPDITLLKPYLAIRKNLSNYDELNFIHQILQEIEEVALSFQCQHCGFTSIELHWNCPSCQTWGESIPLHT